MSAGTCVRPACAKPAAAVLTYDYARRTVWLDTPGPLAGDGWPMCAVHADGLTVPLGWVIEDRRLAVIPMMPPLAC